MFVTDSRVCDNLTIWVKSSLVYSVEGRKQLLWGMTGRHDITDI
jgi:hypothetical protein